MFIMFLYCPHTLVNKAPPLLHDKPSQKQNQTKQNKTKYILTIITTRKSNNIKSKNRLMTNERAVKSACNFICIIVVEI